MPKKRNRKITWNEYKEFIEGEIKKTFKESQRKQIYSVRWIALQTFDKYNLSTNQTKGMR